jgi:hypothetical protein
MWRCLCWRTYRCMFVVTCVQRHWQQRPWWTNFTRYICGVQTNPLGTPATSGPVVRPRMIDQYGAVVEWELIGQNDVLLRKPTPVSFCRAQIRHDLTGLEPGQTLELWHSLQTKSKLLFLVMESEVPTPLLQKSCHRTRTWTSSIRLLSLEPLSIRSCVFPSLPSKLSFPKRFLCILLRHSSFEVNSECKQWNCMIIYITW